ncbi:hypothetical protein O181_073271 [Austropuccinia psidii MF-1]|uniref:Uncharacterized protein n=1 Tax=Austropuccinia psidii MF-1 TaxID=1389203 RepID=A0A9Q3FAS6_9BASI|nr:hypothetical protein [Austropuccinia psidii MF-1]
MYGIDLHNKKDRYFTVGDNKRQQFAFLPFKRQMVVNKVLPVDLELKNPNLNRAFASEKEPLVAIIGHEVDIIINIQRPYPPLLRRPPYSESPKSREALETHIKESLDLGVIRKDNHNKKVEITTPVIVEWHNGKYRMV